MEDAADESPNKAGIPPSREFESVHLIDELAELRHLSVDLRVYVSQVVLESTSKRSPTSHWPLVTDSLHDQGG